MRYTHIVFCPWDVSYLLETNRMEWKLFVNQPFLTMHLNVTTNDRTDLRLQAVAVDGTAAWDFFHLSQVISGFLYK